MQQNCIVRAGKERNEIVEENNSSKKLKQWCEFRNWSWSYKLIAHDFKTQ